MQVDTIAFSGSSAPSGVHAYGFAFEPFARGSTPAPATASAPVGNLTASLGPDTNARSALTAPGGGRAHQSAFEPLTDGVSAAATSVGSAAENGDPSAAAGAAKDSVIGVAAHRKIPHRYELRSIESKLNPATGKPRNSSVAGIFDTKANVDAKTGVPRGQFEVRFDRSHSYKGAPTGAHLNLGVGEHSAVPVPSGVVEAGGKAARALEGLDRVAIPVGVAVDTLRLGEAFHADGNKIGRQTIHTAGSAIGGWSGAFAVAAGGAEVGAAIGLLGGPVGSAVGGVVGGLFGGILGSFGGSAFGEHVADDLAK
jgi:hypothetical protein